MHLLTRKTQGCQGPGSCEMALSDNWLLLPEEQGLLGLRAKMQKVDCQQKTANNS